MKTLLASAAVALVAVSGLAAHAYAQSRAEGSALMASLESVRPNCEA